MIGALLPGIIEGSVGLIQGLSGILSNPKRPTYNIPSSIQDMLTNAKGLAGQTRLPGQDKIEAGMGEQTANYVKNLENLSGGNGQAIGGLSKIYANEMAGKNQLAMNAAQYYAANQAQLRDAQRMHGQYQDKAWDYNVNQPFQGDAAEKSALIGSGLQNTVAGAGNIAGVLSYQSLLKDLFGGTGGFNFKNTGTSGTTKSNMLLDSQVPSLGAQNKEVPYMIPFPNGGGLSPLITGYPR